METKIRCPSCQALSRSLGRIPDGISFAGRTLDKPLSGGSLFRCSRCALHFRWPRVPTEVLDQLYIGGDERHWEYTWDQRKDWVLARQQLQLSDETLEKTILDVGCFDGLFLGALDSQWQRFGIEINPQAAQQARERGIDIIGEDLTKLDRVDRKFSCVIGTDIIEHVADPFLFLSGMANVTRKHGLIMISTGNTGAWPWRLARSRYWYCVIPEHISFINPLWCRKTAEALGLKIKQIETFSHAPHVSVLTRAKQTLANLAYLFTPGLIRWLRRRGLGQTDVLRNPALGDFPPSWMSARDQLLVVFEKQ